MTPERPTARDRNRSRRGAVIVAGGYSTRFGPADKAVANLAGTPMIRRVADRILDPVDELVVNCRSEQLPAIRDAMSDYPLSVSYAEDPVPGRGPIAGVREGLRALETRYALVVACDMPFVDPRLVDYLFERARGRDAAVPRVADGHDQIAQAVYRVDAMAEACEATLTRGERRIADALERLDCVVVDDGEVRERASTETFRNVNTREEFRRASEALR